MLGLQLLVVYAELQADRLCRAATVGSPLDDRCRAARGVTSGVYAVHPGVSRLLFCCDTPLICGGDLASVEEG